MNLLWIVTTQWRAQALGCAGDPNARTPCLDRLAAGSVNFTQAVTPHPFGPFARAAMLTGVPSPENGVRDYFDPLPESSRTIAHTLRNRGYATAFFGKWHLARRDPAAPLVGDAHAKMIVAPAARGGFEFWEGFESGFLLNDPWLHGTRLPQPARFDGYQSDVLGERAAQWTRGAAQGRPWFCCVSLESPHPPYDAPASGVAPRDPREIILPANVPRGGEIETRARRELAGYYAHIEATDRAIGRLLDSLPAPDSTIVVFTSAHGDMHGSHSLFRKGWPYEESVRVPLLIGKAEGGWRKEEGGRRKEEGGAGSRSDAPVSLVNLPQISLAAIDSPSVSSFLPPPSSFPLPPSSFQAISMPSIVSLPHQCDRVWRGIRTPTRKLALNADGSPWLFFNLRDDPLEMENLAADRARDAEIRDLQASGL